MSFGIIWDWDGVVVDSSQQHEESWELLAAEEGLFLPEDHFVRGFGKKNDVIIPGILNWSKDPVEIKRLGNRKEALYRELFRNGSVTLLPGVRSLLDEAKANGIPCIVGSSTEKENLYQAIEVLDLEGYFIDLVAGEDVSNGKPDPEVFLKCANRIGLKPENCLVIEDSIHGIEAGLAGGMKVLGVATTKTAEEIRMAHKVIHRLSDIDLDGIRNLF
jgi:HAD superfamily hydrolase (TIGR01509 family)